MRKHSKQLGLLAALVIADIGFFTLINPTKAYAIIDILGLLLLIATIYAIIDLLLAVVERAVNLSARMRKRLLNGGTMLLALLIAMQSIGQLTVRDMVAIVPLVAVLAFYISYQSKDTDRA